MTSAGGTRVTGGREGADLGIPGLEGFELVGRGGYGVVYRARQPKLNRDVAVKVLVIAGVDDSARRRFEREQEAMGALSGHPAIVTLYDSGYSDTGLPYFVMEYMPGGSLSDVLGRDGAMPWQQAARLIRTIARGVDAAHAVGVLHRDIKPENILMSAYGEPKLTDFGIAALLQGTMTATGTVAATVEHAAPEILEGAPPTPAADVYSLASTLHMLVSGTSPFRRSDDETVIAILTRVLTTQAESLVMSGAPPDLADLVRTAMSREPADRPATAMEFAEGLSGILDADAPIRVSVPEAPEPECVEDDTPPGVAGSPDAATESDDGATRVVRVAPPSADAVETPSPVSRSSISNLEDDEIGPTLSAAVDGMAAGGRLEIWMADRRVRHRGRLVVDGLAQCLTARPDASAVVKGLSRRHGEVLARRATRAGFRVEQTKRGVTLLPGESPATVSPERDPVADGRDPAGADVAVDGDEQHGARSGRVVDGPDTAGSGRVVAVVGVVLLAASIFLPYVASYNVFNSASWITPLRTSVLALAGELDFGEFDAPPWESFGMVYAVLAVVGVVSIRSSRLGRLRLAVGWLIVAVAIVLFGAVAWDLTRGIAGGIPLELGLATMTAVAAGALVAHPHVRSACYAGAALLAGSFLLQASIALWVDPSLFGEREYWMPIRFLWDDVPRSTEPWRSLDLLLLVLGLVAAVLFTRGRMRWTLAVGGAATALSIAILVRIIQVGMKFGDESSLTSVLEARMRTHAAVFAALIGSLLILGSVLVARRSADDVQDVEPAKHTDVAAEPEADPQDATWMSVADPPSTR